MEEKKLAKIKKNNMKLYPIYKMIGLNWTFYYGVRVLFLTQVKNISPSDIVLAGSFYGFCYIIFQFFNSILIEKIGKKNGIVLGQLLDFIAMGIILICPNFIWLLVSQAINAMGFGLKGIAESNLLNVSLPDSKRKGEIFAKIDSKGYSAFCFVSATSVLISGFLYAINPYIPIILCMAINFLAFVLATKFIDIEKETKIAEKKEIKEEIKDILEDLKQGFKFILHSKRLKTLLIMSGVLWGILDVYETYQETLLKELSIPSYYIGFIIAGFQMAAGIFSTKANDFNKKHRNKSLTYIGFILTGGSILLGIVTILKIPFEIQLMIVTFVFITRAYSKGIFQILRKRYLNNFADNNILPKIYSLHGIICNLGKLIMGIIGSAILKITVLPNALLIIGIGCTVIVVALTFYSRTRLGLKAEEYPREDICL